MDISEIISITSRSILISALATLLSVTWSIPLAYALSKSPRASKYLVPIFEALVGVPTVLVGLILYLLLSSSGPLGLIHLLYTPQAIILGESILITPIIVATSYRVIHVAYETFGELASSLGAGKKQAIELIIRESLPGVIGSIIMGFSRAIGELGIALMVGGNIKGYTRVMTTAIALEVARGEYELAITLGIILVIIMIIIALIARALKRFQE